LYYKNGYLIDFPRTMNDLAKYEDSRYQAEIFGIMLSEQTHFAKNDLDKEAGAQINSWDDFEHWLDEKAKEDTTPVTNGPRHDARIKTDSVHTRNGVHAKVPVIETIEGTPGKRSKSSKWYQPKQKGPDHKSSFSFPFSLSKKSSRFSLGQDKS
jgi:hypothetical protein